MKKFRILLVASAALSCFACARVEVKPPPEPPPEGDVRGVLVPEGIASADLKGVEIASESVKVRANSSGQFAFKTLPRGKSLLVAEKRFEGGAIRRILGVATVYFEDSPVSIRIRMRDATLVDQFCLDCHPPRGQVTRRDQIFRDIHPSGIVPVRTTKGADLTDDSGRITCESCHTLHRNSGFPKFTRNSYTDGKLCMFCH